MKLLLMLFFFLNIAYSYVIIISIVLQYYILLWSLLSVFNINAISTYLLNVWYIIVYTNVKKTHQYTKKIKKKKLTMHFIKLILAYLL